MKRATNRRKKAQWWHYTQCCQLEPQATLPMTACRVLIRQDTISDAQSLLIECKGKTIIFNRYVAVRGTELTNRNL